MCDNQIITDAGKHLNNHMKYGTYLDHASIRRLPVLAVLK